MEHYLGKTILVTGGQGFVGCWLVERLLELGARVVVLGRDAHPRSRFRVEGIEERCHAVHADVTDLDGVLRILTEYDVWAVFHLAAQAIVGVANRSPLSTLESNVRGTYTVLEACRARQAPAGPVERIVVASSDHAYGPHAGAFREDLALEPRYPYDVSKGCADMIARSYAFTYDMPVAVTRLANIYGGGDLNWSRIVPDCARALVLERRPVIRSDGTPVRDYLYVEDAVDAYLAVAESLDAPKFRGRAWNAGPDEPSSVLELVRRLIAASGKDVEPEIRGRGTPPGEIQRLSLDSTSIRHELGWWPKWSLDDGLRATYAWYEEALGSTALKPARSDAA